METYLHVGGIGIEVSTHAELADALTQIDAHPDTNVVVHVHLPKTDIPEAIAYKLKHFGEDEIEHEGWTLC